MFRADLHCHSCYSDGTDTPQALVDLAIKSGLSGLSITDHDTKDAYAEALPYARQKGVHLLPGIEFSAAYQSDPIHVLGYAYDPDSSAIEGLCHYHRERRRIRNLAILQNLTRLGYPCTYEELLQVSTTHVLGRPHIALLLMKKGVVTSVKEAFERFLGEGKPAFDPGEPITVEKTIQVIHQAQGKAILAHPHLIKKASIIRHMLSLPFDGLEVYYAGFPPEQEKKWLTIAKERRWLITGGSDYHGSVKPQNQLGSSWVNEQAFHALLKGSSFQDAT